MSLSNYIKAKDIIAKNSSHVFFKGNVDNETIKQAEEKIGLKFIGTYRKFLEEFGAGSFGSTEIYGISSTEFDNGSIPNAIWYNLNQRDKFNFPNNLFAVYYTGSEEIYCLDYSNLNANNEPVVVTYVLGADLDSQSYYIIAEDFGDLFLELVKEELDFINS